MSNGSRRLDAAGGVEPSFRKDKLLQLLSGHALGVKIHHVCPTWRRGRLVQRIVEVLEKLEDETLVGSDALVVVECEQLSQELTGVLVPY